MVLNGIQVKYVILALLHCLNCIFRHWKPELLTQFPAPNDEKYLYFLKIDIFQIELFD